MTNVVKVVKCSIKVNKKWQEQWQELSKSAIKVGKNW